MKHRIFAFLALLLTLLAGCAGAQQLPGVNCFSPGLIRVSEKMKENPAVSADVTLTVENAFYARNLSVLQKLLEGTTLHIQGDNERGSLSIERGGETLARAALTQGGGISIDGHPVETAAPDEAQADWGALAELLQTTPILERVPLTTIAPWLEGLKAGDALGFGVTAASAFTVERTMSDDGERLTKLNIDGSLSFEGETWRVSGFLREPGGKAPKDTLELTLQKDEKNVLECVYSALRKDEIEQKNRKGRTSVAATLKVSGKRGGYAVNTVLKVSQKNDWTADGETLNEKITVSVNLTRKDNTPDKRMRWLNQIDAEGKDVIRIVTTEDAADSYSFTHELTGKVMMDGNTCLAGGVNIDAAVGGAAQETAQTAEEETAQTFEEAVRSLSRKLYRQLDEQTKSSIASGL